MVEKDIIKIINEEASNFDFLGNDDNMKEQEIIDLLQNEEFQKQFICDSLLERKNKIKICFLSQKLVVIGKMKMPQILLLTIFLRLNINMIRRKTLLNSI